MVQALLLHDRAGGGRVFFVINTKLHHGKRAHDQQLRMAQARMKALVL